MGKCQDLPGLLRHPPCLRDSSKGGAIEAWQALRSLRLPWHLRAHQRLLSVFSTLARNRAREVPRGIAGAPTLHLLQYLFAFLRLPSELLHFGKGPGKRESRGIAAFPAPFHLRASSTRESRSPLKPQASLPMLPGSPTFLRPLLGYPDTSSSPSSPWSTATPSLRYLLRLKYK